MYQSDMAATAGTNGLEARSYTFERHTDTRRETKADQNRREMMTATPTMDDPPGISRTGGGESFSASETTARATATTAGWSAAKTVTMLTI